MDGITKFIEGRMKLKVNQEKSAVARPEERHFLGFSLKPNKDGGEAEVLLSERSKKRAFDKIRELTPRNWGHSLKACIARINEYVRGWIGYFGVCSEGVERDLRRLDGRLRRRLRAILLKQWKRKKTIAGKLKRLGARPISIQRYIFSGRKSIWAMSHTSVMNSAMNISKFAEWGLETLLAGWKANHKALVAPAQLELPLG